MLKRHKGKKFWLSGIAPYYKAGAPAGYSGPGDLATFLAWHGLRAYSAAYAAPGNNPAIDIVDQAGANPLTVNILATGALDVASVATWVTTFSVTTIRIAKLYDHSGNGRFLAQPTLANMPVLVLSGLGSLPVIRLTSATTLLSAATITQAQSLSIVAVAKRTTVSGALGFIYGNNTASPTVFSSVAANGASMFAGSSVSMGTATDNAFHCLEAFFNGASSVGTIDGSASGSINPGAGGFSANPIALNATAFPFTGDFVEGGICAATMASQNSNVHSYWGF